MELELQRTTTLVREQEEGGQSGVSNMIQCCSPHILVGFWVIVRLPPAWLSTIARSTYVFATSRARLLLPSKPGYPLTCYSPFSDPLGCRPRCVRVVVPAGRSFESPTNDVIARTKIDKSTDARLHPTSSRTFPEVSDRGSRSRRCREGPPRPRRSFRHKQGQDGGHQERRQGPQAGKSGGGGGAGSGDKGQ